MQLVQRQAFSEEIDSLSEGCAIKCQSKLASVLPVLIEGTLHVGGRIRHAPITFEAAHPMLLPKDLVLIVDKKSPRGRWLLGRVLKIFPGDDQRVRVAEVKTKSSTLIRPISKLVLLEEETSHLFTVNSS